MTMTSEVHAGGPTLTFRVDRFHAPNARMSSSVAARRRFQVARWIVDGVRDDPDFFKAPGSVDRWIDFLSSRLGWTLSDMAPSLRYAREKLNLHVKDDGSAEVVVPAVVEEPGDGEDQ